jgi:hypothetical protein
VPVGAVFDALKFKELWPRADSLLGGAIHLLWRHGSHFAKIGLY